jgi:hypothetical protein
MAGGDEDRSRDWSSLRAAGEWVLIKTNADVLEDQSNLNEWQAMHSRDFMCITFVLMSRSTSQP